MEWDKPATLLLEKRAPFVQKIVREKVETLARERGKTIVTEAEVVAARESFMGKPNPQRTMAKQPQTMKNSLSSESIPNILIKMVILFSIR